MVREALRRRLYTYQRLVVVGGQCSGLDMSVHLEAGSSVVVIDWQALSRVECLLRLHS